MCFAVLLSSQPRCSKWEDGESWAASVSLLQLANSRACNWNIHWDVGTVQTLKDAPSGHLSLPVTALHSGMGMAFHPLKSSCLSPFFVSSQDPFRLDLCSCSFIMEEKIKNNKKRHCVFYIAIFSRFTEEIICSAQPCKISPTWTGLITYPIA